MREDKCFESNNVKMAIVLLILSLVLMLIFGGLTLTGALAAQISQSNLNVEPQTVFSESLIFEPFVIKYPSNFTYVTSFGNYSFSKIDGAYRFTFWNGTVLAPAVRFIIQYKDVSGSWEDLTQNTPEFITVDYNRLQFRQGVLNRSQRLGYIVVDAQFWENQAPKLSARFDYPSRFTFRILFKVTVPKAWRYYQESERNIVNIPQAHAMEITKSKTKIVNTLTNPSLTLLVDWTDFGETQALLKGSTITVVFPQNIAEIDPTTVGISTRDWATAYPSQRKIIYAKGMFWVAYGDGANIVYKTSSDGSAWSSATQLTSAQDGDYFSWVFNGTYISFAKANNTVDKPLTYRMGTPNSDGSISWADLEQTVFTPPSGTPVWQPSIVINSDGYAVILFTNATIPSSSSYRVVKNAWCNGSWSTDWISLLYTTGAIPKHSLVSLSSNKLYALFYYGEDDNRMRGRLYNGTAWEEMEITSDSTRISTAHCTTAIGDDVHVVSLAGIFEDERIYYGKRTYGDGWSTTSLASVQASDGLAYPTITKDGNNLYAVWEDGGTFYYRTYSNGEWKVVQTWFSDSAVVNDRISGMAERQSDELAIIWVVGTSSPYSVKFKKFDYSATADVFTISSTNKEFPIFNASWEGALNKLSFRGQGDITVDTSTYGTPFTIEDNGILFFDWSYSANQVTITNANGPEVSLIWHVQTSPASTGVTEPPEEPPLEIVEPRITIPQLGFWGLVLSVGLIAVGGIVVGVKSSKGSGRRKAYHKKSDTRFRSREKRQDRRRPPRG